MLRTMPRAISLSVRGDFGVGDASAGINVDTANVPPGVGASLDPLFVEAGKREHPLRIRNVQHKMNIVISGRGRRRIPCVSKDLFLTDRKSTRLNSSHQIISYAVFCLKKKKTNKYTQSDARFSTK